ncbi:MAG: 30S ribosome-binding factor RbfA [Hyphomicrobiaceae bacterium]|nr:30S ribosome-binding factor RbfA [Hyphomicrobiaceae bacterium]
MSKGHGTRAPSQRQLRVGETMRKALSELFLKHEIVDPDLSGTVMTVSEVRMSPDLKNATVYLLPLGGENQEKVAAALHRHKRYIRGELARLVSLRYMPDLIFELDPTFDRAGRMDELLRSPEVARDID